MRPHPRIKKTVKWGGAVVCVVLFLAWIASKWIAVDFVAAPWAVGVAGGRAVFVQGPGQNPLTGRGWHFTSPQNYEEWNWRWDFRSVAGSRGVWLPLWIPVLLVCAPTTVAWRLDTLARRRANKHLCTKCKYDRTGLAAGAVCPECGAAPAPS